MAAVYKSSYIKEKVCEYSNISLFYTHTNNSLKYSTRIMKHSEYMQMGWCYLCFSIIKTYWTDFTDVFHNAG